MDIKCKFENIEELRKIREQYKKVDIEFLVDESLPSGVARIVAGDQIYVNGLQNVKNYLRYGFNRIIQSCPYKLFKGKCSGEKCQKYLVENGTGDCSDRWVAVLTTAKFFTNNAASK